MLKQKLPPTTDDPDHDPRPERPERPRSDLPDGLGKWEFLVQCEDARFYLSRTKSGELNLYLVGDKRKLRASWQLGVLLRLHRAWSAIQLDEEVFPNYYLSPTNDVDEFYVCTLPRSGSYAVTPRIDVMRGDNLWWHDPAASDEAWMLEPKLPPELQRLGVKLRPRSTPALAPVKRASLKSAPTNRQKIQKARLR